MLNVICYLFYFILGILWQTWTNNKFESLIGARMMVAPKPTHGEAHKEITGKDCQEIAEKVCQIEFELTLNNNRKLL